MQKRKCRRIKIKIASIVLAVCLVTACNAKANGNLAPLKYIALGDSIAYGYGLSSPETESYPAIINRTLRKKFKTEYYNYAVSGNTSADLLNVVKSEETSLDNADLITVCIGANNVLKPFTACLQQFAEKIGNGGLDFADRIDITKTFDEINELLHGEELAAEMKAGINAAQKDLALIFKAVKARAPQANVAVMLVYSPYHGLKITLPYIGKTLDLGELSDFWVTKLNTVIASAAENAGFLTVDCYTPFADKTGLLNVAVNGFPPRFSFDPHPNLSGHMYLAELHLAALPFGIDFRAPTC